MEEPLIIKRDEIIFRIGLYICLIALLCLIVSFAVISYNQWWHGSVYDESLIAEIFLWIFSFSIGGVPLGLLLIWDSYRHDYKLDENGITIRYRSSVFRTVRRWDECDCLGVECLIYPKMFKRYWRLCAGNKLYAGNMGQDECLYGTAWC